jgi:hypothetical protein
MNKYLFWLVLSGLAVSMVSYPQTIPIKLFDKTDQITQVSFTQVLSGQFFYYNDDGQHTTVGTIGDDDRPAYRYYLRNIDPSEGSSGGFINIKETVANDTSMAWNEMIKSFLLPNENAWKTIAKNKFSRNYTVGQTEREARVIIQNLIGLNPDGNIRVTTEERDYQTGLPVFKKTYTTKAVRLDFTSEYRFTALDRRNPLKIVVKHSVWLSPDIPGGLLERLDEMSFPEIDADYTVVCHLTVDLIGTEEEALEQHEAERDFPALRDLVTERLTHLKNLGKTDPGSYETYLDILIAEISDALTTVAKDYPGFYAELQTKYANEIAHYEFNYAGTEASDVSSESLIDAFMFN